MFVPVATFEPFAGDDVGSFRGNQRYARATSVLTHQILLYRPVCDEKRTFFPTQNPLGSPAENSQLHLFRTHLTYQRVLDAFPISCNHVRHAHQVRVQEQSCQGYASMIIYPHFSPV